MSSSVSPAHNGVIFDTNVLSLFVRIQRLDLLQQIFAASRTGVHFYITPTIQRELVAGIQNKVSYLADALQLIKTGQLQVIQPIPADQLFINSLPAKLAPGEAEAIALCYRLNLVFISHDRKAVNYCSHIGIPCLSLAALLERMQKANLVTEAEIQRMLQ